MDIGSIQGVSGYATKTTGISDEAIGAAEEFLQMLQSAETQAAASVTGGGDPHELVTALAESKLALEATVAIRDRVVEAYNELLRMPV
ncbi:flagellar hook-basal body complex protein FliE [Jannaschia aquimarina]|uniref:FliE protein n=1 Tax=Jannaschia aquimarina TaxID=935700 RepID=A0A0D1EBR0_9RHOB|nr:flagellar hook-basal body complex protein FliE [Jannaschia aquimarina]KIT14301.1 Flagellar hook-basal body complex protein FliE [Jannaschia aquimarina]SNS50386.1 flagellar hook-basal body complex protein FliE [Jannaschia aquimarina]